MTDPGRRYQALAASRVAMARAATVVRYGLVSAGLAVFLGQVGPLIADGQFTWGERRVMGIAALVTLGGFAAAAWVVGALFRALAELLEVLIDAGEAAALVAHLLESRIAPDLHRAAESLAGGSSPRDAAAHAATVVRRAVQEAHWGRAERGMAELLRQHPGWPGAATLAAEVAAGRKAEIADLRARLNAAIAADDLDRAVACRDALTAHLRGKELHDLDDRVARWAVELVRRRAGSGALTADLVASATRAAESFGDTVEGARLLSALPELRRRAGLCPDCGRPSHSSTEDCPEATTHSRRSTSSNRPRRGAASTEPPS